MRGTFVASANESVVSGTCFPYQMQDFLDLLTGPPRLREKRAADDRRYGHWDLEAPQRILYVTSEIADFVKAGGLGEVSAALPRSLRQQYDVRILIPGYRQVLERYDDLPVVGRLPAAFGLPACDIGRLDTPDGLILYVLLCPDLYDREGSPYGDAAGLDWSDNDVRFARLALAAAEIACGVRDLAWTPDLLHLNDWTSALTPGYLAWRGRPLPSVLTIHNLAYQGLFERERLSRLGVPESAFQIEGVEFYGKLSFLKAGIVYSSHVTTVSSTYAREITTPELGCGLDGLLRVRADEGRLTGILNGIDESWDPRTDPYLASPFEAENLKGKAANRDEVRKEFGLAVSRGPLFAVVSRLVHQKGVDLAIEAAETIVRDGGQIVVTGRGEGELEQSLEKLARALSRPGRRQARLRGGDGAADVCRQRFPPDAVALRALRPVADVCPEIRLAADRAPHRRPRRHDRGRGDGLPLPRAARSASFSARSTGRSTPSARARSSTPCAAPRWAATTPGSARPSATSGSTTGR